MAKNWSTLKKTMKPASRARVDARVKETLASLPLAEIRKAVGLTQAELAKSLATGQGSVSKLENAADMYLSTLRRFVAAMGGDLTIKASFPKGREFIIDHVADLNDARAQNAA